MRRTLLVLLLPSLAWLSTSAGAIELIAHPSVNVSVISLASAKAMFSMRLSRWPDGTQVRVFVLPDGHPTHSAFCKEALNLYPYQLRQTWDRQVYSGTGQAPFEVATEEEMLSRVASTPGAIGYVRKVNANDPVRILSIR